MGGQSSSRGQTSSLGSYDSKATFGQAFNAAHKAGGPGHTFTYKDKMYTTDCKDGGNYRASDQRDDRSWITHNTHQIGYQLNGVYKDMGGGHQIDRSYNEYRERPTDIRVQIGIDRGLNTIDERLRNDLFPIKQIMIHTFSLNPNTHTTISHP